MSAWRARRTARTQVATPVYAVSMGLFRRLLGAVYVFAFGSLGLEVRGLIGQHGILPASEYLARAATALGPARFWRLPTFAWLGAGDRTLHVLCILGVLAGLLVVLGRVQTLALAAAWSLYLSLSVVGQIFLGYQWDALLLETGLIAIFLVPPRLRARHERPVRLSLWLLRWLLFRLMFASGVVKLSSGDPAWRSLQALRFHFETQPLPTWIGWWAHQLPASVATAACVLMFAIELLAPFAVLAPPRWLMVRRLAAAALLCLQLLIALTGNYGFFNLLSAALTLCLLDDRCFKRRVASPSPKQPAQPAPVERWGRLWRWPATALAMLALPLGAMQLAAAFRVAVPWPAPLVALARRVAPVRSINGYGLFAVMTTARREIVIEGSDDGRHWQAYLFRDKPSDPHERPRFIAPHMPRVDWQMWFAALGDVRGNPWFVTFLARLAEAEPTVLALLEHDPFAGRAPRLLRARLEDWRFTSLSERRTTGDWWQREDAGVYLRPVACARLRALMNGPV